MNPLKSQFFNRLTQNLPQGWEERQAWMKEFACKKQCKNTPGFLPFDPEFNRLFGPDSGYTGIPGSCPLCSEKCWAGKKVRVDEITRYLISRDVPDEKARIASYGHQSQALKAVREYEKKALWQGRCLTLCGETGRGKTCAAISLLKNQLLELGEDRFKFMFVPMPNFFLKLQGMSREFAFELIARIQKAAVLVLDDLGTKRYSEYELSVLDAIFYQREGDKSATVVTINKNPEHFRADLGERITSRIMGDWGQVVVVTDRDFRQNVPEKSNLRGAN